MKVRRLFLSAVWLGAVGLVAATLAEMAFASGSVACQRWVIRNPDVDPPTIHHVLCDNLSCPGVCECYTGVYSEGGNSYDYCICLPSSSCPGVTGACLVASNPVGNLITCMPNGCVNACSGSWGPYDWQALGHPQPPPAWGQHPEVYSCTCP